MTHARMSHSYELSLTILNYIFIFLYNIEFVLKIIGLGVQYFTHDKWNILDFIWVAGSNLSVIFVITHVDGPLHSIIVFLRAFRMVRLLRFVEEYGGAATITTLINSAPQIKNILALISLFTFIYATLGMNLFGSVMYRDQYNAQNNFRSIFEALLLLLRWLTGEDWNAIMHELASVERFEGEEWVPSQTYEEMHRDGIKGCGTPLSYPFFISYFILNAIVVLDLSIGVFINALSDANKFEKAIVNRRYINNFLKLWADYDPNSKGWIHVDQLLLLIYELPIPFGHGKVSPEYQNEYNYDRIYEKRVRENLYVIKAQYLNDKKNSLEKDEIKRILLHGEIYLVNESKGLLIKETRSVLIVSNHCIPIYEGNLVHFKDVFQQVIRNAFEHTGEDFEPNPKLQAKFKKKWRKGIQKKEFKLDMVDEYMAGLMMLNKYRMKRYRNK